MNTARTARHDLQSKATAKHNGSDSTQPLVKS
jgi:hypothetical protein